MSEVVSEQKFHISLRKHNSWRVESYARQMVAPESIDELSAYRERLYNNVLGLGKKLRLSQKKIEATIKDHPEITRIDEVLMQLKTQRDSQAVNS